MLKKEKNVLSTQNENGGRLSSNQEFLVVAVCWMECGGMHAIDDFLTVHL